MSSNPSAPAVIRLHQELRELKRSPEPNFTAGPVGDDLFNWHFIIKGPPDSPFEGGIYHGQIIFPNNYPSAPPDVIFFTPNGRFELNKKICLTATSYHPESWTPSWSVSTLLTSIICYFPTRAEGAVGGIDLPEPIRKQLAIKSRTFHCNECSLQLEPDPLPGESPQPPQEEPQQNQEEDGDEGEKVVEGGREEEEEEKAETPEEVVGEEEEQQETNIRRYNFNELKASTKQKPSGCRPVFDIPILALFGVLCFLIFNTIKASA